MRKHLVWARNEFSEVAAEDGDYFEGLVDEAVQNVAAFYFIGIAGLLMAAIILAGVALKKLGLVASSESPSWLFPLLYFPIARLCESLQDGFVRRSIRSRVADYVSRTSD